MQFKKRVMDMVGQHSEVIVQPKDSVVNFLSFHHGAIKAFRIKAHGRHTKSTIRQLINYQTKTRIPVYLVSEQDGHIPRFETLNRYLRWREGIKEKYNKEGDPRK